MTELLRDLRHAAQGEVAVDYPLAARTTLRVGGPARFSIRPRDPAALVACLRTLAKANVGWMTLGGGSDTVVGDGGVDGAVLWLLPDFCPDEVEEFGDHVVVTIGAGASSARLVQLVKEQNGVGVAAWASGIPGSVGGMVALNAGTPAGAMSDHLEAVEVATPDGCSWLGADKLRLGYRTCRLPAGAVLTRARLRIRRGSDAERVNEHRAVRLDLEKRRLTQPLGQPNFGSVFVNPPNNFAGRLIEQAGLRGARRGNAQISTRHANFIVNLGDASAADVIELILLSFRSVKNATGIELKPEVRLAGTFTPPLAEELQPYHQLPVCLPRTGPAAGGVAPLPPTGAGP
jgi:UDP-N-acetylmuramate dehydrogenase